MCVDTPEIKTESRISKADCPERAVNVLSGHFPLRMKSEQLPKPLSNPQLLEVYHFYFLKKNPEAA